MRINLETAKLAKEKGYDESCSSVFVDEKPKELGGVQRKNSTYQNQITRPIQSDLQKWLRAVHDIHINIPTYHSISEDKPYGLEINIKRGDKWGYVEYSCDDSFESYEDALENGLQEGLKEIKQDESRS